MNMTKIWSIVWEHCINVKSINVKKSSTRTPSKGKKKGFLVIFFTFETEKKKVKYSQKRKGTIKSSEVRHNLTLLGEHLLLITNTLIKNTLHILI